MGHQFKFWLEEYQGSKDRANPEFGASYIMPPIGGYTTHNTTWMYRTDVTLNSHWNASWIQEGSRRDDISGRNKVRKICHFVPKGPTHVIAEIDVPLGEDRWWKTKAPDGMPREFLGLQHWHETMDIEDL